MNSQNRRLYLYRGVTLHREFGGKKQVTTPEAPRHKWTPTKQDDHHDNSVIQEVHGHLYVCVGVNSGTESTKDGGKYPTFLKALTNAQRMPQLGHNNDFSKNQPGHAPHPIRRPLLRCGKQSCFGDKGTNAMDVPWFLDGKTVEVMDSGFASLHWQASVRPVVPLPELYSDSRHTPVSLLGARAP